MPAETEFKLRAQQPIEVASIDAALREAGIESRPSDRRLHVDLYLDDMDLSLSRAGIGLRLRLDAHGSMLCCKTRGGSAEGLFVREEHASAWPQRDAPNRARELPTTLRDRVEPFALDRHLSPILRLETQREIRHLRLHDQDLCELAIDLVEATGSGRSTTFFEIELEVIDNLPGNEQLAGHLLRTLPLHRADDDKPTHAAARLGLRSATTATNAMAASTPLPDAVVAIVKRQLERMRNAECRVRERLDPAHLHTLRVELRRLRCFVRAFESTWSPTTASWLLDQLALAGRRLGTLRDLDVMLEHLAETAAALPTALQSSIDEVQTWMQREREEAHRDLLTWFGSEDRLAAEAEIERRLLSVLRPEDGAATTLGAAVPGIFVRAAMRLKKRFANLDFAQPTWPVHEVRIAAKHLRYLIDELPFRSDDARDKIVRQLVLLQQQLGDVRDRELASGRMLSWLGRAAHADHKVALIGAALGGLATQYASRAKKARRQALLLVQKLDRKRVWRALGATSKR